MLAALFSQFVLLPAVGFASVTLFPQDAVTVVTLLVVTTSPGGGFSGLAASAPGRA
jgi:predicted Na+-dependent transporter